MTKFGYIPSVELGRFVSNIDQADIESLEDVLFHGPKIPNPLEAYAVMHRTFTPVETLHSIIIARGEVVNLQKFLGSEQLDDAGIEEFEAHICQKLSKSPETRDVKTLPARVQRWGDGPSYALTIADSVDAYEERVVAKEAAAEFLGLEELPNHIFNNIHDRKITQVILARARTLKEARLLGELEASINAEDAGLLPEIISFKEIDKIEQAR
jgi:hypothetical protein